MYAMGCEPSSMPYRDLFMVMAHGTGVQYIRLNSMWKLLYAIIGGAKGELSSQKFASEVLHEVQKVI
ncbi:hypothetical protein DPMN_012781 [Dreissena polymorpha]|uniref:Uncharacterized protein n=1 Tax=Dreissena polymorpha TaxID=45954 RepID=A0A9D4N663_DREPO|nr:hypothetical protein DPMN_012781 [Dreissena polymorpha]